MREEECSRKEKEVGRGRIRTNEERVEGSSSPLNTEKGTGGSAMSGELNRMHTHAEHRMQYCPVLGDWAMIQYSRGDARAETEAAQRASSRPGPTFTIN
jgi:hypothetical protein